MSVIDDPSKSARSFTGLIALLALISIAIPGLSKLTWDYQSQSHRTDTWILFVECLTNNPGGSGEPIAHLVQYLRHLYGEKHVISPLNNYDHSPGRSDPKLSLSALEKAESESPLMSALSLTNSEKNAFRILVSVTPQSVREPFPDALTQEFKNLSWIDRSPGEEVWVAQAQKEQFFIIPAVLIAFIFALRIALNSWRAAIGAITTSACTVVCVFGMMGWLEIPLNLLILAIPVSILAIGTSEDVHLISHAQGAKLYTQSSPKSALIAHRMAISCTAFTTAMGFAALVAGGHPDIQKFAVMGALSVGLRYIILHILFPHLCHWIPERDQTAHQKFARWLGDSIWNQNLLLSRHYRHLFAAGLLCLLLSVVLALLIQPSIVPLPLMRSTSEHMSAFEKHADAFGSQFIADLRLSGLDQDISRQDRLSSLEALQMDLSGRIPELTVLTESDFWRAAITKMDPSKARRWSEYSDAYLDQISLLNNTPKLFEMSESREHSRIYVIGQERDFTAQRIETLIETNLNVFNQNLSLELNDNFKQTLEQYSKFKHTLLYSTLITSMVICMLIGFIFLSSIAATTTLFCNLLPAAGVGIGICALGIPISPVTSLFISLSLGVAVNDTLYLLSTYHASIRAIPDRKSAVRETLRIAAYPILISTITLSLAFLILSFSEFREITYLGTIITLALLTAMFCDLWVTPVLFLKTSIIPIWEQLSHEYMEVIHGETPLFRNTPARHIKKFIYFGKIQRATPDQTLFHENEQGRTCILILSGNCHVSKNSIAGSVFISRLQPGDIAGELSLETGSKRTATLVTVNTVDYIEFDWQQLESFRHQYPRAASSVFFNLSQIISQRLRTTLIELAASPQPISRNPHA